MENTGNITKGPEAEPFTVLFVADIGQWLVKCSGVSLLYTEDAFFEEVYLYYKFIRQVKAGAHFDSFEFRSEKGGAIKLESMTFQMADDLFKYLLECKFQREILIRKGKEAL